MATPFPNIVPDQASTRSVQRTMNNVAFGHGYEQRQPVGLNYRRETWQCTWSNLIASERDVIVSFLEAISDGSVATWTTPIDNVQKKYVLEGDWTLEFPAGNLYTVKANFRQVFDLV